LIFRAGQQTSISKRNINPVGDTSPSMVCVPFFISNEETQNGNLYFGHAGVGALFGHPSCGCIYQTTHEIKARNQDSGSINAK
jgi:hypothetical protein